MSHHLHELHEVDSLHNFISLRPERTHLAYSSVDICLLHDTELIRILSVRVALLVDSALNKLVEHEL